MKVAFFRIGVVAHVSSFAQSGLNEAFGFAVGAWSIGSGEVVADAEFSASVAEQMRTVTVTIVGEQAANGDAALGEESDGGTEEGDGSIGLLVGQDAGEGEAGVVVDGDMQRFPTSKLRTTAATAVAANGNPLITGQGFDVEMEHIAWSGVFITHDGGSGMEMAPAVQMSAL